MSEGYTPTPTEWREFNINHFVRVRLTEKGIDRLRKNYEKYSVGFFAAEEFTPPKADEDGWTRMQAWEFMQEFGEHIGMGLPGLFETTILIELPVKNIDTKA